MADAREYPRSFDRDRVADDAFPYAPPDCDFIYYIIFFSRIKGGK